MQRSNMAYTVIEFNVWLWNRIRIADYFPALMLPEAESSNSNKIEVGKQWSWLPMFLTFFSIWTLSLRPVVLKKITEMTLQKNWSKHIDCGSEEDFVSFFKMKSYPSFELEETKSDPISELENICVSLELLPFRKKCFCTGR